MKGEWSEISSGDSFLICGNIKEQRKRNYRLWLGGMVLRKNRTNAKWISGSTGLYKGASLI